MNVSFNELPTSTMSDFELVEHYERVMQELASVVMTISHVRNDDVLDASIMGIPCRMEARQLKQHIILQMNFFERMVEDAQERIARSEGKVG